MLTNVLRGPSTAINVARRTTAMSLVLLSDLVATALPGLVVPADRVTWEAWALGNQLAQGAVPTAAAIRKARIS